MRREKQARRMSVSVGRALLSMIRAVASATAVRMSWMVIVSLPFVEEVDWGGLRFCASQFHLDS
jgi:hypothetical protein